MPCNRQSGNSATTEGGGNGGEKRQDEKRWRTGTRDKEWGEAREGRQREGRREREKKRHIVEKRGQMMGRRDR